MGRPAPAPARSISPEHRPDITAPAHDRLRLNDHQGLAPAGPPPRQQNPKQPIPTAKARPTSSAALQHGNLVAQCDSFQHQLDMAPRFPEGDRDRSITRRCHACRLTSGVRDHQRIRADQVLRSDSDIFQPGRIERFDHQRSASVPVAPRTRSISARASSGSLSPRQATC